MSRFERAERSRQVAGVGRSQAAAGRKRAVGSESRRRTSPLQIASRALRSMSVCGTIKDTLMTHAAATVTSVLIMEHISSPETEMTRPHESGLRRPLPHEALERTSLSAAAKGQGSSRPCGGTASS